MLSSPPKKMKNCILIFITLCLISCSKKNVESFTEKLAGQEFIIKDSVSTIIIGHCDITECLDAEIMSGQLYFPEKVFKQIKNSYLETGHNPISYQHDLYLIGKNNITYELFDSIVSPKMGNKYLVKGKVVGFKDYGIVFKIYSYELLNDTIITHSINKVGLSDVFPVENIVSVKITNIHGKHLLTTNELVEFSQDSKTFQWIIGKARPYFFRNQG